MSFMLFGKGHSLQTAFGWHEGIGTPSLTRAEGCRRGVVLVVR